MKNLAYLTAPSGAARVDDNGVVQGVTDTGMKVAVWFCEHDKNVVVPAGTKPFYES